MKVLVIYDTLPEDNKKAIVEMTEVQYANLRIAQGSFINAGEYSEEVTAANLAISNAFVEEGDASGYCETALDFDFFRKFTPYVLEDIEDLTGVDKMIHCGFCL